MLNWGIDVELGNLMLMFNWGIGELMLNWGIDFELVELGINCLIGELTLNWGTNKIQIRNDWT